MKSKEVLVFLKNAGANVLRGTSTALVALVLPPFLTRAMTPAAYGTWSLILQIGTYVAYLDFGVQVALARFIAHAGERQDGEERDELVSASFAVLLVSAAIAFFGMAIIAAGFSRFFNEMPDSLRSQARIALWFVGGSVSVGLVAAVFGGILVGIQRNEIPALIISGSRLISAVLLVLAARSGGNLVAMGLILAGANLVSYLLQFWASRRIAPYVEIGIRLLHWKKISQLLRYCSSLSVWMFGMLLVSGLDLAVVGHFDFSSVAYYAVAASVVAFLAGVQNAVFSALIQPVAVLCARESAFELGDLLVKSTRFSTLTILATGIPLCFFAEPLLRLWVGPNYAKNAAPLLILLLIANGIRLAGTPFGIVLIGTAQQRLANATVLAEGLANLTASIILGRMWGATGVAIGTLISAPICLLGHVFYNLPRTQQVVVDHRQFVRIGLLKPLISSLPAILTLVAVNYVPDPYKATLVALAGLQFVFMTLRWGLTSDDRAFLKKAVERFIPVPV